MLNKAELNSVFYIEDDYSFCFVFTASLSVFDFPTKFNFLSAISTAALSSICPSFDPELESIQEFFQRFPCVGSNPILVVTIMFLVWMKGIS